jgi:Zn-dependent M28 family amino/carboxypeptidase
MTVFGEERGLLGSQYYAGHPIKPLVKTIANINLEQVGRADSKDDVEPQVNRASLTGFSFSTMTDSFVEAGRAFGVDVYDHPQNSESYFARSDNVAFAAAGIPAHTLCVEYDYPDYHGRGDHWD